MKVLRAINHKRCQGLYETYEGNQFVYLVTSYFEGESLIQKIINENRFSEEQSLKIINSLLKSMAYLHSLHILHRDIKPENLICLSSNKNKVALVDFGFATFQKDYDKLFTRCGTPGYVAPEVLDDQSYNTKADVFSCGVILFIM